MKQNSYLKWIILISICLLNSTISFANSSEQHHNNNSKFVKLPSSCTILKSIELDLGHGGHGLYSNETVGIYNLIDTDSDYNDYEMIEFIQILKNHYAEKSAEDYDEVEYRGIIKGVQFFSDGRGILSGIELDIEDFENYYPTGCLNKMIFKDLCELYKATIDQTQNNNALKEVPKGAGYAENFFDKDLQEYKRIIGIK
ncbi:MAG: hypothetical protein K6C10_09145 [Prevotella sp.]|nr:hypothetical protein [Prevotella sp.]